MGETLAAALVALVAAVIVAVWNTGGRAALERRTIRQEIDLAQSIAEGPERRALERLARERTLLYLQRRTVRPLPPTTRRRLVALTAGVPLLAGVLSAVWDSTSGTLGRVIYVVLYLLLLVAGSLTGYWMSRLFRFRRARTRHEDLISARALLEQQE